MIFCYICLYVFIMFVLRLWTDPALKNIYFEFSDEEIGLIEPTIRSVADL